MAGPNMFRYQNQFNFGENFNKNIQSHLDRQHQKDESALDRAIKNEYLEMEKDRTKVAKDTLDARTNINNALMQSILGQKSAEYDYNQAYDQAREDYAQKYEDTGFLDKMAKRWFTGESMKSPSEMKPMDYQSQGLLPEAPSKGDRAKQLLDIMNQNPNAGYSLFDMLQYAQLLGNSSGTDNDAINSLLGNGSIFSNPQIIKE
tara:strand:- start:148 stop:756 length:609 start_codon:yes stop_codon:yes gene_type:complete